MRAAFMLGLFGCLLASAAAAQHTDISIYSTADGGGALTTNYDFGDPQLVTSSLPGGMCPGGMCFFSSVNPGFDTADGDLPAQSLFALNPGTQVSFAVQAIAVGASVKFGSTILDAPGESVVIGSADLHVHPSWQVQAPVGLVGDWPVTFRLTTTAPGYSQSANYTLILTNGAAAPTATPTPTASAPTSTPGSATCPPAPATCSAPGKSKLVLKAPVGTPDKRVLLWKWLNGNVASPVEFGDPTTITSLTLCLYDDGALVAALPVDSGGTCDGKPCWKVTGVTGFKFTSKSGTAQGLSTLVLKAGAGKAKIIAKAKGAAVPMPTTDPLLSQTSAVTVQVVSDLGDCWGAVFAPPAKQSAAELFKDQVP
jgi:hypothetical protein